MVKVAADAADASAPAWDPSMATATICAIIVTWNRKTFVSTVLQALSKQTYPTKKLHVVVVDNAGTDGTLDDVIKSLNPERVVDNDTEQAHEPKFDKPRIRSWAPPAASGNTASPNNLGFASLTVVRNRANMGGCGGFNTGFAFVEHWFGKPGFGGPDYVWLVDDDVDLPADTLEHLSRVMDADPEIGLVGSRTCDINERDRTIETTIYFNSQTGSMQDDAPPGHPQHQSHRAWVQRVGGPRGFGKPDGYRGQMQVDVVSACSMLARWSAVVGGVGGEGGSAGAGGGQGKDGLTNTAESARERKRDRVPVGFWDYRYFIYCDDADWCLRFARAGWKVVLSLDAVVFHTPWNLKLTPARIYYANRNRLWMIQKTLPIERLRAVTRQIMQTFLFDSLHAAMHRRQFHARIILNTGADVANDIWGKTGSDGPASVPIIEGLKIAGCLKPGAKIAIVCNVPDSVKWANELCQTVVQQLNEYNAKSGEALAEPMWQIIARNDVSNRPADAIVYGRQWKSRLKKQLWIWRVRPRAVVVFDQINDFPVLLTAPWTLHVDHKKIGAVQLERDGWGPRLGFMWRWLKARRKLLKYADSVVPRTSATRYG